MDPQSHPPPPGEPSAAAAGTCACECRCCGPASLDSDAWVPSLKRRMDEMEAAAPSVSPAGVDDGVVRVEIADEAAAVCGHLQSIQELRTELEEERSAAASAASEAMSMILRLQREKAEVQMEARQFKGFAEEKMAHDRQEIAALEDLLLKYDETILSLSYEVETYRHRLFSSGIGVSDAPASEPELGYEATTAAIVMAGLFLSFLVEYIGHRVVLAKAKASAALSPTERKSVFLSTEVLSILVMEAGIIFHSLLIGLTLVVSGDEYFITLFIVILFHQMFEGIALGSRIATIGTAADAEVVTAARPSQETSSAQDSDKAPCPAETTSCEEVAPPTGLTLRKKLGLAALFAFTTPIGMAIGIGVLQQFNGNDKSTIIAIGTLDALSAGILVWVGLVEMWAADWMTGNHGQKAELADADILTTVLAFTGLVAGLVVMSLLGKWA